MNLIYKNHINESISEYMNGLPKMLLKNVNVNVNVNYPDMKKYFDSIDKLEKQKNENIFNIYVEYTEKINKLNDILDIITN